MAIGSISKCPRNITVMPKSPTRTVDTKTCARAGRTHLNNHELETCAQLGLNGVRVCLVKEKKKGGGEAAPLLFLFADVRETSVPAQPLSQNESLGLC